MKYTQDWLIQEYHQGNSNKFLHFWGHKPSLDGSITQSCFSQWWEGHLFIEDEVEFPTAEHYMMACKAALFNDMEVYARILEAKSPGEAKALGRKVRDFDQAKWNAHRCEIVVQGNLLKFSQHEDLKHFLLNTGKRILVEASPVDAIWGIGLERNHSDANNPENWKGTNLLGFCLMEVRDRLGMNT